MTHRLLITKPGVALEKLASRLAGQPPSGILVKLNGPFQKVPELLEKAGTVHVRRGITIEAPSLLELMNEDVRKEHPGLSYDGEFDCGEHVLTVEADVYRGPTKQDEIVDWEVVAVDGYLLMSKEDREAVSRAVSLTESEEEAVSGSYSGRPGTG